MTFSQNWSKQVLENFGQAAVKYSQNAQLQRAFAWRLAQKCSKEFIPKGIWVDLGTGTGILADSFEALHPNQSVIRVDGSEEMLCQHHHKSQTQLCDLNLGLPNWPKQPTLIASNFALHWLDSPTSRLKEWFEALAPGGWLAIALPIQGSFHEWHLAAHQANVPCSALSLPSHDSLLKALNPQNIYYQKLHKFTQTSSKIYPLLNPISKIGAQSSRKRSLSIGEWRRLQKSWSCLNENKTINLTWLIQLLLIKR